MTKWSGKRGLSPAAWDMWMELSKGGGPWYCSSQENEVLDELLNAGLIALSGNGLSFYIIDRARVAVKREVDDE